MASTVYYAAVSLDGYIAEPEEKLTWLMGFEGQDFDGPGVKPIKEDYPAFMEGVGSLVMGSKTYDFILDENWAYGDTPTWVYTRRDLPKVEGATNLEFASGDVAERHAEMLEAGGGKDLWVIGGGDLASQYVAAGLLDTVILTVVPVILGAGLPLFAEPLPKPLRLLESHPFDSGMARLAYEVQKLSTFGGGSDGPQVPGAADADGGVRAIHIDDLPEMEQGEGTLWRPIRRTLELTGVSANAYTGVEAGDEVIEHHDELSPSAGAHEELYLVTSGRATFVVDGAEVDAPVGTLIAIDVGQVREATAAEPNTTVLVFGGKPGTAYPPAPFEYWYAAQPSYLEGDFEGGIVILTEGLDHHPDSPGLNYQLACYNALAGRGDDAIEHLKVAIGGPDPRVRDWAAEDEDLDSIRDREDWPL